MEIVKTAHPVLTVSQLNKQVKQFLEYEIGLIQVEGEISNLSRPSSGHLYFTMKDSQAQIRCVYFKNRHKPPISSNLEDGLHVIATGRLSLYEARGDYQLIVEDLAKAGLGALYQQYELLKNKLAAEGLFSPELKKPLPKIPKTIGIITSPSGAAIQDMLSTIARRFPQVNVVIYPCEVQGINAPAQLIQALRSANRNPRCDVLILARGGGSLEDLWAFNDESLAREIAKSQIPIISGVGHETDVTIADFVADYRAETPTAAAAIATPDKLDLIYIIQAFEIKLIQLLNQKLTHAEMRLHHLKETLSSPRTAIATYWQRLDYQERQLKTLIAHFIKSQAHRIQLLGSDLHRHNPKTALQQRTYTVAQLSSQLCNAIKSTIEYKKNHFQQFITTLHAVSPLATLSRGYAIATKDNHILFNSSDAIKGDLIQVRLSHGALRCEVTEVC